MPLYPDKYSKYSARYEIYSYSNMIQLLPSKESLSYQNWLPETGFLLLSVYTLDSLPPKAIPELAPSASNDGISTDSAHDPTQMWGQ